MLPFAPLAAPAGVDAGTPSTPDPPTNVRSSYYAGSKISLSWTNADSTSSTDIGFSAGGGDPSSVFDNIPARSTYYETDSETEQYWFVRHNAGKGGTSAWVAAEPPVE